MRRASIRLGALAWLAASLAGQTTVRVDPNSRYQTFEGWGTSLCWWANVAGNFPAQIRSELAEQLFTLNGGGLGLNILRFNAGGGENPSIRNTMEPRARMEGYWAGPGQKFNPEADRTQRAILEDAITQARAAGLPLRFEVFGNSPPWWMTISGSATGNTGPNGHPVDNLASSHYKDYARYLMDVSSFLEEKYGIRVESISPFNEPSSDWWKYGNRQEGCYFSRPSMARLIGILAPLAGRKYLIAATEDWSVDQAVESWDTFDGETRHRIGRLNLHTYSGTARSLIRARAERDRKTIWMSEVGDGDGTGLTLALTILRDLKELGASAWVNWQALSPDEWGMIWNDHVHPQYHRLRKYYVMAQFSRFIRPGSRLIGVDHPNALAALGTDGRLVLIFVNRDSSPLTVRFDLTRFGQKDPEAEWIETEMVAAGGAEMAVHTPIPLVDGVLAATVGPRSISTFRIRPGNATGLSAFAGSGTFRLRHRASGLFAGIASGDAGAELMLRPGESGDTGQQFRFEATGGGHYRIINRLSGHEINVRSGTNEPGAHVIQWGPGDIETTPLNSQWSVETTESGSRLRAGHSGLLLSACAGGGECSNSAVTQSGDDGSGASLWDLDRVLDPEPRESDRIPRRPGAGRQ